jgi:hypothetical protein
VADADVACELGFEGLALGTEDVLAGIDGGEDGMLDLVVHHGPGKRNGAHVSLLL